MGIGFQNQVILPDLLTGTLGTLLSNGMTTGSVCVILLTLLMEFTSRRRRRLNVAMNLSSLPRIDSFLQGFAASAGWNETSINRLRSAGEETLSSLLSQDEEPEENARRRLIVAARRADAAIEMEFVVTTEGGNLEDKLAYMNEQPEIQDEREISFRLLEPVYNLFRISTAKARTTICRLVLSFLSQFFQRRRHFSSQPKDRSTTHRFGSTTKVCSSLRFTTSTEAPSRLCTAVAKGFPVYPPSTSTFCTWLRLARRRSNIAKAPARSVTLAVVT